LRMRRGRPMPWLRLLRPARLASLLLTSLRFTFSLT
jgi:hypothetical protein